MKSREEWRAHLEALPEPMFGPSPWVIQHWLRLNCRELRNMKASGAVDISLFQILRAIEDNEKFRGIKIESFTK